MQNTRGFLDGINGGYLCGWAQNMDAPEEPVVVDIFFDDHLVRSITADALRPDLITHNLGNGKSGFQVNVVNLPDLSTVEHISARISANQHELSNSPLTLTEKLRDDLTFQSTLKIDPYNIEAFLASSETLNVRHFLIDLTDTCNADCVYCPNTRSKNRLTTEQFERVLMRLNKVNVFQIGCGQEPTTHPELPRFLEILHNSSLRPKRVSMITNGILLARHPWSVYEGRLHELQFSLDTVDAEVNDLTRVNTDFLRITKNLEAFHTHLPAIDIVFSVVVNALTIAGIENLIAYGDRLGVTYYNLREIFNHIPLNEPTRNTDCRDWIEKLKLSPGQFDALIKRLMVHPSFEKMRPIAASNLEDTVQMIRRANPLNATVEV